VTVTEERPVTITGPGVYDQVPEHVYHADPIPGGSLSSSGARKLLAPSCPALFKHDQDNPQPHKKTFDIGTAAHKDEHCVMRGRRRGEQEWQEVTWTLERAQRLGVVDRNPQWKKQPKTMLVNRATGEICRLIASDVLHAMPHTSEELDGSGAPDGSAQVPRVTVRELVPDAPAAEDPWHVDRDAAAPPQDAEDDDWPAAAPGGAE
jgi:hypothetical protein